MCKVFPSSLGTTAMRWFDGLEKGSIGSYEELTKAFGTKFMACSKVPRPLDSLLSMAMKEGETLKMHFNRYWEPFNEIDGDFDDIVVGTFKTRLHMNSDLKKSLTMKPTRDMHQLMDQVEERHRVEDDQV